MHVRSSDGVEVAVHDLGGMGRPVLMAHATGFHGRVWQPLAAALRELHCWSVDLRAHGDSALPETAELRWEGFADDVLAAIDALGLDEPFGVGHSGGGAALVLAEQRRPGTFRALYLYEPVVTPPELWAERPDPGNIMSTGARRRRRSFESHDAAYQNFVAKAPFDRLDPAALRAYVDHGFAPGPDGDVVLKCSPDREAEVYASVGLHRAHGGLHAVRCPVTVAVGHTASLPPGSFAAGIVAALPQGHLQEFGDLGHFGPLEDPRAIALGIRQAFAGL